MTLNGIRAITELNNRVFAIGAAGPRNYFFEVKRDGTFTNYGSALAGDKRPQMTVTQNQVLILSGGLGYVFALTSNTLTRITDPDFPTGATKCGEMDGYFIVLERASQQFAISALNDGLSWDALDFASVEGAPGNVVSFLVEKRTIWFLAEDHGEVFYDSGNADFPFQRYEGAYIEMGCAAIDSPAKCDNTVYWLGKNQQGGKMVCRANGYRYERVSVYAIENMIESYGDVSDARGYGYQEGGHTFYRLDFPQADKTLVFDVGENEWHERTYWDFTLGIEHADLARSHTFAWGKHLVGDYRSGKIYVQSADYASDAGNPIRRVRSAPDIANAGKWFSHRSLTLGVQAGVGLDGGPPQTATYDLSDTDWNTNTLGSLPIPFGPPWYLVALSARDVVARTVTLTITGTDGTHGPYTFTTHADYNHGGDGAAVSVPIGATPIKLDRASVFASDSGIAVEGATDLLLTLSSAPSGTPTEDTNPQIALQVSNDGGFTWGGERWKSLGKIGQFTRLLRWWQLGRSNNRAYRILLIAKVKAIITSADIDASQGR